MSADHGGEATVRPVDRDRRRVVQACALPFVAQALPAAAASPPERLRVVIGDGAAFVAEYTDLVLTVPKRLGDVLSERAAIRILPVPFAVPAYDVKLHWHERLHNDEGHRWLRRLISDLLSA